MSRFNFILIFTICTLFGFCKIDDPFGFGDFGDLNQCDLDVFILMTECTDKELESSVRKLCLLYLNDYTKNCP
ncbi:hypothetical protein LEP1GSC132_4467 [Leptospira kirschneri str. 200803703]|uniref:hypothetical protein n=1 Tax=Leptospira kirschneri TaxID=29507 RepID=UPI0002BDE118|nr:hypothetical protein [Leptospira kirschneri]EMO67146.1 hypothetical protein LEP1GSC132_4467 [Leptospira kirschneri str. 200803703]